MVYYTIYNDLGTGRAVRVRIHDLYGEGKDGVFEQINSGHSETINDFHGNKSHKISVRLLSTGKLADNCGHHKPGIYKISELTGWSQFVS